MTRSKACERSWRRPASSRRTAQPDTSVAVRHAEHGNCRFGGRIPPSAPYHRRRSIMLLVRTGHSVRTAVGLLLVLTACAETPTAPPDVAPVGVDAASSGSGNQGKGKGKLRCDSDNGGITLPPGFCAVVVADLVDSLARHIAVTPSGDVFVAINSPRNRQPAFGIVALRDRDGDGR